MEKRRSKLSDHAVDYNSDHNNFHERNKKTMIHREIERQRRKEMTTLYGSLRSLLPLELIKGKRSISDHINEARDYIKHMEKKTKELSLRREELKKLPNIINQTDPKTGSSDCNVYKSCLTIHSFSGGLQVLVSISPRESSCALSRVLKLLLEEGLSVVSCVFTEINGKLLYTVQSEVNDLARINLTRLEEKLKEVINQPSNVHFQVN